MLLRIEWGGAWYPSCGVVCDAVLDESMRPEGASEGKFTNATSLSVWEHVDFFVAEIDVVDPVYMVSPSATRGARTSVVLAMPARSSTSARPESFGGCLISTNDEIAGSIGATSRKCGEKRGTLSFLW